MLSLDSPVEIGVYYFLEYLLPDGLVLDCFWELLLDLIKYGQLVLLCDYFWELE